MSFDKFRKLAVNSRMGETETGESTSKRIKEKIAGGESKKEDRQCPEEERSSKM